MNFGIKELWNVIGREGAAVELSNIKNQTAKLFSLSSLRQGGKGRGEEGCLYSLSPLPVCASRGEAEDHWLNRNWRVALALLLSSVLTNAQTSLVDATFNPGKGCEGGLVESVLPQPDGKVLVCGNFTSFNGSPRGYIARLMPDGSIDTSFMAHPSYWVRHMALQTDGKIIIGGFFKTVDDQPRNLIARLNPDGSLDPTFNPGVGANGTLSVSIVGNADPFVFQSAVQPDGKILITGNFTTYNRATANGIARLNTDGSLDTTFQMGSGFDRWGRALLIQPNGQIVVTGWFNNYNGRSYNHLIRLNSDGTADPTLNAFFGDQTSVYQAVQVAGGKYVVTGHSLMPGNFDERIRRLNPDGSVDTTFKASADEKVESLLVQADGKLIIGGYFGVVDGKHITGLARLNPDGTLDETLKASIDNFVWTVAFAKDNKLLLCGGFWSIDGESRVGVARLFSASTGSITPVPTPTPTSVRVSGKWAQNKFTLSVPTAAGKTYSVDYKTSFSNSAWLRLSNITGDGSTNTVVDADATGPHRFYRVLQN
jgi:uncharacterized delta-60 repeat protein